MIRVISAELRKLRRPTLFLGTLGSVVGVTVLVTSLLYLLIDRPGGNAERGTFISREILSAANGLTIGFSASAGLLGIVALCVFAANGTGIHVWHLAESSRAATIANENSHWKAHLYEYFSIGNCFSFRSGKYRGLICACPACESFY